MIDPDQTPTEGIPAEEDTSPDLRAGLSCPSCRGERMVLHVVEREPDGSVSKAIANPCPDCKGAGRVDRRTFCRIRAISQGRPPR